MNMGPPTYPWYSPGFPPAKSIPNPAILVRAYVAMFDEVDEGTAIFKLAENQTQTQVQWPSNNSHHEFVVMDADGYKLPSDWYLRLTGEGGKMLRKEAVLSPTIPIKP